MTEWKARRFWTDVTVEPVGDAFAVALDGRQVRTPGKTLLTLPTEAMAQAMAEEWRAQQDVIDPGTMPVTRTANSAIDKVATQHAEVADLLAAYGDSDLLCYRADAPDDLVTRQAAGWDPMLDWAAEALGARLETRTGVMHAPQDPAALAALSRRVHALGPFELAAFHDLVSLSGSLVLGFAAATEQATPDEIWALSRIDEEFQADRWGHDAEAEAAAEARRMAMRTAERLWQLSRPD